MRGFFLVLLASLLLWGGEKCEGTKIAMRLETQAQIEPDRYVVPLKIFIKNRSEERILATLGAIDRALRELALAYRGGEYELVPHCYWQKEKRICKGYEGGVFYSFLLKTPQEQNRIFTTLKYLQQKLPLSFGYEVERPHWEASSLKREEELRRLRLLLIEQAKKFAKEAGKRLGKICEVVAIDYSSRYIPLLRTYKEMPMAAPSLAAPEPAKEKERVKVEAHVRYLCR